MLRVSSEMREDEGVVLFHGGRVVQASIRSTAVPMEIALLQAGRISESDLQRARARQANGRASLDIVDLLVDVGAISHKELERQLRLQIESVVFELMSWREGFFSFEERPRSDISADTRIAVSTESLLMEGARRIDEWSRIADIVPNLAVIPELAPVEVDRDGAMLDLLPHEWQVLTMIDGDRDLRGIAAALARDEFEIAKIAYGLATTGIIVLQAPRRTTLDMERAVSEDTLTAPAARALAGELSDARAAVERFLRSSPSGPAAPEARDALDAIVRLQRVLEAHAHG